MESGPSLTAGQGVQRVGYAAQTPIRQLGVLPIDAGPEVRYAIVG